MLIRHSMQLPADRDLHFAPQMRTLCIFGQRFIEQPSRSGLFAFPVARFIIVFNQIARATAAFEQFVRGIDAY